MLSNHGPQRAGNCHSKAYGDDLRDQITYCRWTPVSSHTPWSDRNRVVTDRPHNEELIWLLSVVQLVFGQTSWSFRSQWPLWAASTGWQQPCATELFGCPNLPWSLRSSLSHPSEACVVWFGPVNSWYYLKALIFTNVTSVPSSLHNHSLYTRLPSWDCLCRTCDCKCVGE